MADENIPSSTGGEGSTGVPASPSPNVPISQLGNTTIASTAPAAPAPGTIVGGPASNGIATPIGKPKFPLRTLLAGIGGLILVVGLSTWFFFIRGRSLTDVGAPTPQESFPVTDLASTAELAEAAVLGAITNQDLSINGLLKINKGLILTPGAQPATPQEGQIYLDQASGTIFAYHGGEFKAQVSSTTVTNVTQQSIGVGSVNGQSGAVNLAAGPGIGISGTTITNTGARSIAAGSGASVSNDGNGNYTISTTVSGPYVQSVDGVDGALTLGVGLVMAGQDLQNTGVLSLAGLNGAIGLGAGLQVSGTNIINSGVTTITTNGTLTASSATGAVNLSLPQSIATSASPTFAGLTLGSPLAPVSGGSGISISGSIADKQILVGNGGGNFSLKTLTGAGGIVVTSDAGNIIFTASAANLKLQNVYDNSDGLTTPEVILNSGGDTGGIDIQNNNASPITGSLFAVRTNAASGLGAGIFNINSTGVIEIQGGVVAGDLITPSGTASNSLTIKSGNASAGNSGNIVIDAGTASGTTGSISIGGTNASAVSLGRSATTTTVQGNLVANGTAAVRGASVSVGTGSTTTGSIIFSNGSNNNTLTLQAPANVVSTNKVIDIPDLSGTMAIVQSGSTSQTGNLAISGTGFFTTALESPLLRTTDTSGASTNSAALTLRSGNATGATSNTGNVSVTSGNATGTSGNVSIDAGTGATAGGVNIGTVNAAATTVGRSGGALTLQGNGTTQLRATSGADTTSLGFTNITNGVNFKFNGSGLSAGDYDICTAAAICPGSVALQVATPGAQQTGHINVSGTIIAGTSLLSPLLKTEDSTVSSTANLTIGSGNATVGASLNSGAISIDTGTATGTVGGVSIGTANAPTVTIGKGTGSIVTINSPQLVLGTSGPAGVTGSIIVKNSTNTNTVTLQLPGSVTANQSITLPNASGTVAVSAATPLSLDATSGQVSLTGVVPVANGGTALSATPTNGQLLIGNGTGYTLSTLTQGTGITISNGSGTITVAANVGCSACASNTLGNLAATTAINSNLLPNAVNTIDLGSASLPFKNLYIGTAATNNIKFEAAASITAGRTLTLPNLDGTVALVQTAGSSTAQTGDINVGGALIAGTDVVSTLFHSADGATNNVTVRSGTFSAGTSGNLTLTSGNTATGTSGNIVVDAGTGTTKGNISIGATNASGITVGRSGLQVSIPGGLSTGGSNIVSGGGNLDLTAGLITSGAINAQTISTAANFTGTLTVQGATALTLGTAGPTGNTGAIVFKNSAGTNNVTLQATNANPTSSFSLTLPNALPGATSCLNLDSSGLIGTQSCSSGLGTSGTTTAGNITKFGAGATSVTNSLLSESGTVVSILGTANSYVVEGKMTVGLNGASGNRGSIEFKDGANPGKTATLRSQASLANDVTIELPTAGDIGAACLSFVSGGAGIGRITTGSCAAGGSGGNVTASGAMTNRLVRGTNDGAAYTVSQSIIQDDGTSIGVNTAPNATYVLRVGSSDAFNVKNDGQLEIGSGSPLTLAANGNITNAGTFGASGLLQTSAGGQALSLTGNPTNVATQALLRLGNAIVGGNSATNGGTYIGLNAPNTGVGSAADFINLQKNGASEFLVNNSGDIIGGELNGVAIGESASQFTIIGGTGTARTLTVQASSTIDQNLQTTAGVTFNSLTLSTNLSAQYGGTGVNGSAATNGQVLIGNGTGYALNTLTAGSGINIANGTGTITISAPTAGNCASCATRALDNLQSVALNTSLLPGSVNTIDLGSVALPFRNLYIGDAATNNVKFEAPSLSGTRTITLPDATGTVCLDISVNNCGLVKLSPSATQTGTVDVSGSVIAPTHQTKNTTAPSTNSAGLTLQSGNASGATSNSGSVTLSSGSATGTSGSVAIDVGAGGTNGDVTIGGSNANNITIGRTAGGTLTLQGGANTKLVANNGSNNATVQFANIGAASIVYQFDSTGAASATYDICTSLVNTTPTSGCLKLQGASSTAQGGATNTVNLAGTGIFGVGLTSPLLKSADSITANTAGITIRSGNATVGTNLSSGSVTIDSGTKTGTGTAGAVSIGTTNAPTVNVGTTASGSAINLRSPSVSLGVSNTANASLVFYNAAGANKITLSTPATNPGADVAVSLQALAGNLVVAQTSPTQQTGSISVSAGGTFGGQVLSGSLSVANTATDTSTAASIVNNASTFTGNLIDAQSNISGTTASRFKVAQTGDVTISTGSLSVNAVKQNSGADLTVGTTNSTEDLVLQGDTVTLKKTGNAGVTSYNFALDTGGQTYTICTTANNCVGTGGGVTTSPAQSAGYLSVYTNANNLENSIVRANANGLGIGTAVVSTERMNIQGATNDNTTAALNATSLNGTSALFVRNDGRVGIGIAGLGATGPEQKLDVNGNAQIRRQIDATAGTQTVDSYNLSFQGSYWNGSAAQSVSVKLVNDVTGSNAYTLRFQDNAGGNIMSLSSTGQLGIGNIDPTTTLDINGASTFRGTTGVSNAAAGQGRIWYDSSLGKFRISQGDVSSGTPVDLVPSGASFINGGNDFGATVANLGNTNAGGELAFKSGGNTERARFDTNGNFLLGVSTGTSRLTVLGSSTFGHTLAVTGTANQINLTNSSASGAITARGLGIDLTGTATTGSNTNIGINFGNANPLSNNTFTAINVGTGFNNILSSGSATLTAAGALQLTGAVPASASMVQLGTTLTSGSANGTFISTNTGAATTADLINLQNNGVTQFKVTSAGNTTVNGTLLVNSTSSLGGKLTVTSGGAEITGGVDNNSGGITEAGAISGATTIGQNDTLTNSKTGGVAINLTGAPAASSTSSLIQVGTAINGGSANGTYIGINPATFTGNFMDFQVNGTSNFRVSSAGAGTFASTLNVAGTASFTATGSNAVAISGAPASSATSSLVQIGSAIAGGSSNGTFLGMNAGSGFTGNLMDLQLNGAQRFIVTSAGNTTIAGTLTVTGAATLTSSFSSNSGTISSSSGKVVFSGGARNDVTVNLVPEYEGATLNGDGTSNIGTMTSGFCSDDNLRNINPTICPTNGDEHSYYEWTTAQATVQDYDVYVRWQVPSNYDKDLASNTLNVSGWRTNSTDELVQVSVYDDNDAAATPCSNGGSAANVATGTATWTQTAVTISSCDFDAGEIVTFKIKMTAGTNDFARLGEIKLTYKAKF